MRCIHCGCYFNPDRIDAHQGICGKLQTARPKGVDGASTQGPNKMFNSEAQRTEAGSAFVSTEQFQKKEEKRSAELANRHRSAPPGTAGKNGLVPCPHCSRHFSADAAERHIPICAKVVNKPGSPSPKRNPRASSRTPHETPQSRPPASSTLRPQADFSGDATLLPSDGRGSFLPSVDTPRSTSSTDSLSRGGGIKAARNLRRKAESTKLPELPPDGSQSGRHESSPTSPDSGGKPPRAPRQAVGESTEQLSTSPERTASHPVSRVGLRRCALLYRLLRHLPIEVLTKELADSGTCTEDMDQESMIEALLAHLA